MVFYVAGDIGGTNSRLQLVEVAPSENGDLDQENEKVIAEETYPSQQYASLIFVIQKFLSQHCTNGEFAIACCLAVAGPVRANKSIITNVNWILDGDEMAETLNMKHVQIINDFAGVGYGLLALERSDVVPINDVPITDEAPKACVGAGTGLGEAYLTWNGTEYDIWSSEGGHADFAPRDELEFKLMEFLRKTERVERVSVERLVSGMGIPRIYDFYCSLHPDEVQEAVQRRIRTEDPGSVIAEYAQNGKCTICRQTIDTFVACYGAECGNLALKLLPFGGLYIAGGIAPKLLWAIQKDHRFWHAFVNKGRMRSLLEKVPTFIVTHKQVGLLGARVVCRRLLRQEGFSIKGQLSHFTDTQPRGVDILQGTGKDVEAIVDETGRQTGRVLIRNRSVASNSEIDERPLINDRLVDSRNNVKPMRATTRGNINNNIGSRDSRQTSSVNNFTDSQLIKSAIYGGLIASVATIVINTLMQRYNGSSTTRK